MNKKFRMLEDWDIEGHRIGPKKGEILEIPAGNVCLHEDGTLECWFVTYNGEIFEIFPYEVEEV